MQKSWMGRKRGIYIALLRKRPREGPSDSMMVRAVAKSSGVFCNERRVGGM